MLHAFDTLLQSRLICAPFLVTSLTIGTMPNTHSSFSFSSFIWTSICTAKPKLGLGTMLDTHSSSLRLICAYFHAAWFTLVTIHSSLLVRFSWAAIIEISMVSQLLFSFLFGWCGWYLRWRWNDERRGAKRERKKEVEPARAQCR